MSRERFEPGAKRPRTKDINSELSNDLFGGDRAPKIGNRFDNDKKKSKPQIKSLLIRDVDPETLEKLKDYVYTLKKKGDYLVTQSIVLNEALEFFLKSKESITEEFYNLYFD